MARARTYELTDKANTAKFGPQAQLIVDVLRECPATAAEITTAVEANLTTRQDPGRVVTFYLTTWKKSGIVRVLDGDEVPTGLSTRVPTNDDVADPAADEEVTVSIIGLEAEGDQPAETPAEDHDDQGAHSMLTMQAGSLRDAVFEAVFQGAISIPEIMTMLQSVGRDVTARQIKDTVSKLVKRGDLKRDLSGNILVDSPR